MTGRTENIGKVFAACFGDEMKNCLVHGYAREDAIEQAYIRTLMDIKADERNIDPYDAETLKKPNKLLQLPDESACLRQMLSDAYSTYSGKYSNTMAEDDCRLLLSLCFQKAIADEVLP